LGFVAIMIWQFRACVPRGEALLITSSSVIIPGSFSRCGRALELSRSAIQSCQRTYFRSRGHKHTWSIRFIEGDGKIHSVYMLMIDCDKIAQGISDIWGIAIP
jgi:hypothetical protein